MTDDTMPPDDDRDAELARRLGRRLDQQAPLDEAGGDEDDRALLSALLAFKAEADGEPPPAEASARVWAHLEGRLGPRRPEGRARTPLRLLRLQRPAWTWVAAAASLALLVALGWRLLLPGSAQPTLLAAATAEMITYTTADGSTVTLRPHSQLYGIEEREEAVRLRLHGEGFFDVVENAGRTFSVEANGAVVTVLGTRFDVSTWGSQTAVYLDRGRIRLADRASGRAVVLAPGQRGGLTEEGVLLEPETADADEYLDWMRREITFAQRPLRRILAELAHHYRMTLDVPPALREETLTGRITLSDPAQSLADLGAVLGGRFVRVDDATYRFEAE